MGFSLSGMVINRAFNRDSNQVLETLGIKGFQKAGTVTFDEASIHFWSDEKIGIGFYGNGTLIFCGIALMTDEERLCIASHDCNILSFYINDNNETYCFDYFSKGVHVRRKWLSKTDEDVNKTGSMGKPLVFENPDEDPQEEVFNAIEKVMGQSFYKIAEEETIHEFKIV